MRLFIAVNLPAPVRAAIGEAVAPVQRAVDGVRWTRPEALHITLKFLGSVPEHAVEAIERVLRACASRHAPAEIELDGVGAFPNERRPRIFWVGVQDGGVLGELARELDDALRPLGCAPESRAFTPHVTIGRVRAARGATPAPRAASLPAGTLRRTVRVETIDLMRSHTERTGARYERLYAARLGGGGE